MTNRLHWIDTVKAICIICVYVAHCTEFTSSNKDIARIVTPFYVNAFFFVSGYLLYKKYLQDNIFTLQTLLDRIKTCVYKIIIPTIIFSSIICIPKTLFHNNEFDSRIIIIDILGGCSFWFTSALAIAQITIFTLFLINKKQIIFYVIATATIFLALQYFCDFTPHPARYYFPWYWRTGLIYTFIITIGGVYFSYEKNIDLFLSKGGFILIIIITSIIYYFHLSERSVAFIGLSGKCTLLGFIGMICTSLILFVIAKNTRNHPFTDFIGRNSIIFYFLSGAVPNVITMILKKILSGNYLFISTLIISIGTSYIIAYIVNKYIPFLIDVRSIYQQKSANNQ